MGEKRKFARTWEIWTLGLKSCGLTFEPIGFLCLQGWLLKVVHDMRPLFWVIEQPTSSQMFLMPTLKPMLDLWQLALTTTWLGCFGHLLQKGTKLMTNLKDDQKNLGTTGLFLIRTNFLVWEVGGAVVEADEPGMKSLVLSFFQG